MKKRYLIPAVLLMLILLPGVSGDIGPKPSMKFNLVYETQGIPELIDGQQIECDDAGCLDARPLEWLGPQGFDCTQDECNSIAYGYSQYHRLVINFSDQQRQSNIFKSSSYFAEFNVRVTDTGLVVEEVPPIKRTISGDIPIFVIALVLTLILELLVAFVFVSVKKEPRSILVGVLVANMVSLPIVWLVFPYLPLHFLLVILFSEIFAVLFEGYFIFLFTKKTLALVMSLILSLLMNLCSFIIGGIIFIFLV